MRKALWPKAVPAAIVMLAIVVAPATAAKTRVVKQSYTFDLSNGGSFWASNDAAGVASAETMAFKTAPADDVVAVTVTDETASNVSAMIWQGDDGPTMVFCNEIASVPVRGGEPVYVRIMLEVAPGGDGCATPEMPTTGTVTAKFSTAPKEMRHANHHHH